MSKVRARKLWAALVLCGAGTLSQWFLPNGCIDYSVQLAASSFDFCSVINCTGSTYFNVCDPALFVDCPTITTNATP